MLGPVPRDEQDGRREPLSVTWLGHATVLLDVGGARILTDPVLRDSPGLLRRVGPTPQSHQWAGTTAVLLSHLHLDHADVASLRRLEVPVATAPGTESWVARQGHRVLLATEEQWTPVPGAGSVVSGVEIRPVKAVHHSRPMPHRPNAATGFLLRSADWMLWFAGDTELYDDIDRVAEIAGRPIDLALLPIGGWGPRLSPGHMGPADAAETCRRVEAVRVLPIHHGTFHPVAWPSGRLDWMRRPAEEFVRELEATSPATELVPPVVGEPRTPPTDR